MSSSDLKATFPNPDAAGYVGFANLPNQVSFSKAMILLISFFNFYDVFNMSPMSIH